jgi:SAM-dependent methyltransferase
MKRRSLAPGSTASTGCTENRSIGRTRTVSARSSRPAADRPISGNRCGSRRRCPGGQGDGHRRRSVSDDVFRVPGAWSEAICRQRRRGAAAPSGLVDGCWSDRPFQHLARPDRALDEMVRVLKPGGTIVVVDPDYGTQVMELPDQSLARKVLDVRAHHALRNGTLAHRMAGRFVDAGWSRCPSKRRR